MSPQSTERRGLMLVLSSPSGAGKTTLSRSLLGEEPDVAMSVSVTTRPPRPGEVEGRDYHFISDQRFDAMVEAGELLEWAKVFDHRYGTPRAPVEQTLACGLDILFDIDWQGTQQLKAQAREDVVSIFILPPSLEDLRVRLTLRAQDHPEVIEGRMARAAGEISHWAEYDYVLVNDDLDHCLMQIRTVLAAERLRRPRQPGLVRLVRGLLD